MEIPRKFEDQSERLLRRYLATRSDITPEQKELIVKHYLFVFDPNYNKEIAQRHIARDSKKDPKIQSLAMDVFVSFIDWLINNENEKKKTEKKKNFIINLFRKFSLIN